MKVSEGIILEAFIPNLWRSFTRRKTVHQFILKTATDIEYGTEICRDFLLRVHCWQTSFDHYFLQSVWKKPQRLVSDPQSILVAPSKDSTIKAFSVLSESTNIPNYVQIYSTAKVTFPWEYLSHYEFDFAETPQYSIRFGSVQANINPQN